LTDALRGTRETPNPSCASLLAPLIKEFGEDRAEIRMFHTPNLTGLRKAIIPKRINEGWGLQHMKLYGFDDELILSGYGTTLLLSEKQHVDIQTGPIYHKITL
jgi:CDP-diacylglycerol---glycerol-3-phosphate 3-phosphatidyltransferase